MSTTSPNSITAAGAAAVSFPQSPQAAALDPSRVADAHRLVLELTQRVFGNPASIQERNNPETGSLYYSVDECASGTVEEIAQKCRVWHSQPIPALTMCGPDYCLHVVPTE